jgi:hypothetical protein
MLPKALTLPKVLTLSKALTLPKALMLPKALTLLKALTFPKALTLPKAYLFAANNFSVIFFYISRFWTVQASLCVNLICNFKIMDYQSVIIIII